MVWAANRLLKLRLCPICMGVGGTWMWMIAARIAGIPVDPTMLATLLGGSVAGTAYLLERRLPGGRSLVAWKALFIPIGLVGAYGVAAPHWSVFGGALAAMLILVAIFFRSGPTVAPESPGVADLERKMKDCC